MWASEFPDLMRLQAQLPQDTSYLTLGVVTAIRSSDRTHHPRSEWFKNMSTLKLISYLSGPQTRTRTLFPGVGADGPTSLRHQDVLCVSCNAP